MEIVKEMGQNPYLFHPTLGPRSFYTTCFPGVFAHEKPNQNASARSAPRASMARCAGKR